MQRSNGIVCDVALILAVLAGVSGSCLGQEISWPWSKKVTLEKQTMHRLNKASSTFNGEDLENQKPKLITDFGAQGDKVVAAIQSFGTRHSWPIEDRLAVHVDQFGNEYYAVFDGHSGDEVSKALESKAINAVEKVMASAPIDTDSIKKDIKQAIVQLDSEMLALNKKSGSTLLIVINTAQHLITVNVGDSRAIMIDRNGQTLPLSRDQKPSDPFEVERIISNNGFVTNRYYPIYKIADPRVNGQLAVSRAMGDKDLKSKAALSCEPDVIVLPKKQKLHFNEPVAVLLATDGLWDTVKSEQAGAGLIIKLCRESTLKNMDTQLGSLMNNLVNNARSGGSRDDISIVAAVFERDFCESL